ncbi:hypothetical protein R5R35_003125 [Gryllus longicercus]|uniref:C-type lectin domain-containing protein n=2 Tax=Gryllus longicercus TaxID=2509291 RepID=A0AAN9VMA0_9ORTH
MAPRDGRALNALLASLCLLLAAAPARAADHEQAKTPPHPQPSSNEPLVMRLSQNVAAEHASHKHSVEGKHHSECPSPNPNPSQPSLVCTAQCPLCPTCPPIPSCTSPCPTIPKCPEPQKCPNPCATCPACSTCKKSIPPGYEHFPGHGYYRLHTVPVDWMTAKATCEREGAYLVIINSQEEANLVKKLFNRDRDVGTWLHLGFHDLYKEGKYVTLFGEPLSETGYITWSPGQPDNYNNNENCGSMHPEGGLNDLNCSVKKPFVCELPV